MGFSKQARAASNAIVSCHETGKPVGDYSSVAVLSDDAGISYGTHQATHKSGSLFKICKLYCDLSTSPVAAQLTPFLPTLKDAGLRHRAAADTALKDLLRRAGQESAMRYAQNRVFERNYLDPAAVACQGSNFVRPLSLAVIFDSMIQGGYAVCRDRTQGSGEHDWISHYVAVRRHWLANHQKPIVRKTVYRMETFEKLIQDDNWDLTVDFFAHGARVTAQHLEFWMSGEEPAVAEAVGDDPDLQRLHTENTELIAEEEASPKSIANLSATTGAVTGDGGAGTNADRHIHLIVSGETLSKIAARYKVRMAELLAANPLITDPNRIMVGQELRIPNFMASTPVAPEGTSAAPVAEAAGSQGMPNTAGTPESKKYDLYAKYFERQGVQLSHLEADRRAILGLRVTSSTKVNKGLGEYNDRIVVAWQNSKGERHAKEFEANTEPSARYEDTPEHRKQTPGKIDGVDANQDGIRDLGCLPDGLFVFERSHSPKFGNILRPVGDVFVVRDVDHDGDFDAQDRAASVQKLLNSGRSMLFHAGASNLTGSAGCQTMAPVNFREFWDNLGKQNQFQYALVTVA